MRFHHIPVAMLILATACSTTTADKTGQALEAVAQPTTQTPSTTTRMTVADVVATQDGWRMTFPIYDCEVYAVEDHAREVSCADLGKLSFAEPTAQAIAIANKLKALEVYFGSLEGIAQVRESQYAADLPRLTTKGVELTIYDDRWLELGYELHHTLIEAQTEQRERAYQNTPECEEEGEVVLDYDSCGPYPWDGDEHMRPAVCGPAVLKCGAPLAKGAACHHHGACQSGTCSYPEATCQ